MVGSLTVKNTYAPQGVCDFGKKMRHVRGFLHSETPGTAH